MRTWPCPSLKHLEVYGQPFPEDCLRSVAFPPAWTFHTIPGLKSIKIMGMGDVGPRSLPETDSIIDHPSQGYTGFQSEHMRACMQSLTHLELHNAPFQFTTFRRALAEAKNLKSLSIHIDLAEIPDDLVLDNDSPNMNGLLLLCADTLEHVNLLLSCGGIMERTTLFFFGTDLRVSCFHKLTKLKTLRLNLRSFFSASFWRPEQFGSAGVEYEEYYKLVNAAEEIRLPRSLQKLTLVEERDARVYPETVFDGDRTGRMALKLKVDIPIQQGMYSEQLKRFAAACEKGKSQLGWQITEVLVLSWRFGRGDPEAGLDRRGVAAAFGRVPDLKFSWSWLDEKEISSKTTGF
ncbi:hypothetical protein NEMBOFW57_010713 [Staphylotrichum longicolle]|uniref:Uncharacterized protein n=1 Tax=Staphylotrichum longicolle TaxID=669026 RepID=A0AAD4HVI5_9PEZI|nr:hypothetical protein NEMBOFW57_010713 [Staphylotrichum longicolle]